jgi:hypothetical protein
MIVRLGRATPGRLRRQDEFRVAVGVTIIECEKAHETPPNLRGREPTEKTGPPGSPHHAGLYKKNGHRTAVAFKWWRRGYDSNPCPPAIDYDRSR